MLNRVPSLGFTNKNPYQKGNCKDYRDLMSWLLILLLKLSYLEFQCIVIWRRRNGKMQVQRINVSTPLVLPSFDFKVTSFQKVEVSREEMYRKSSSSLPMWSRKNNISRATRTRWSCSKTSKYGSRNGWTRTEWPRKDQNSNAHKTLHAWDWIVCREWPSCPF